jgi:hypothetical protein
MSHFLYLHKDLSGTENVWKVGVSVTPYTAVRLRQKFCWNQFGLDYLWFGQPEHVAMLEAVVKRHFHKVSGKVLKGFGTQTELFQVPIDEMLTVISNVISEYGLKIKQVQLADRYTASNSGSCPFGIPSEKDADWWLTNRLQAVFNNPKFAHRKKIKLSPNTFNRLFEIS